MGVGKLDQNSACNSFIYLITYFIVNFIVLSTIEQVWYVKIVGQKTYFIWLTDYISNKKGILHITNRHSAVISKNFKKGASKCGFAATKTIFLKMKLWYFSLIILNV